MILSSVVAVLVAALVAAYVARRPRVVEYLNARHLQIWGPDGNVQATISGADHGAWLHFHGERSLYMSSHSLIFRSTGVRLSQDDAVNGTRAPQVNRIEVGIDEDGSAFLRLFDDREWDDTPMYPTSEIKVSREGRHELSLGPVRAAQDPEGLVIHPGPTQIKILGEGRNILWLWPSGQRAS